MSGPISEALAAFWLAVAIYFSAGTAWNMFRDALVLIARAHGNKIDDNEVSTGWSVVLMSIFWGLHWWLAR